jgi:phenylacetate-coenzyme A ligase PaaK-like adenylate-forming protein
VGPDYFVRAVRRDGRDELVVSITATGGDAAGDLQDAVERRLRDVLGVKVGAQVVSPGELDALTEVHTSPKPKRFRDERSA